jgi:transposase
MPTKPSNYSKELKQEAAYLVQKGGKSAAQVAQDLGVSERSLSRWCQQWNKRGKDAFPGSGHQPPQEEELRPLKRELEVTRMERDIIKKAVAIFSRPQP